MAKVLITEKIDPAGPALLEAAGHTWVQADRDLDVITRELEDCDAVITRIYELPGELIGNHPNLKIISKHGVGYDNIDLETCKKNHITVSITPDANGQAVAEHTMALLMDCAKRLSFSARRYKEIGFAAKNLPADIELMGKTLTVIGCGKIGSRVARMAHDGFQMRVLVYDPYIDQVPEGCELVTDRDYCIREADFLTLHPTLNAETRGGISAREFAMMKPTSIIINCGRGPMIVEEDMIAALQSGQIGGAGLDVTAKEPCDPDSPLFNMDNVILTPHFAATSREAAINCSTIACMNVIRCLKGEPVVGQIV